MQTLQQQLIALNRRANAASDAIKLIEKINGKKAIKNDEIAALEASLSACPEGRTKAGLAKRIETLKSSVQKLTDELAEVTTKAGVILDLSTSYDVATVVWVAEAEQAATEDTKGGENTQQ